MTANHKPSEDFLDKLEWQLQSEFRRQTRFHGQPVKRRNFRFLKTAGIVFCSMLVGVMFIKAAEHVKDSWIRDLELAKAQTQVQLIQARLELFKEIAGDIKIQVEKGLLEAFELKSYQKMENQTNLELQRAKLDLSEVELTGRAPKNELYAPIVRNQDFVTQRLQLDKEILKDEQKLIDEHQKMTKKRVENGLLHIQELEIIKGHSLEYLQAIEEINSRLNLRSEFLEGILTAQEVSFKEKLTGAVTNLKKAQTSHQMVESQVKRMKSLAEKGMVSERDLKPLEYELMTVSAELRLAQMELDFLQKVDLQ